MQLNCKVIKQLANPPPPISTSTPPFEGTPQVTRFWKFLPLAPPPPPLNYAGGEEAFNYGPYDEGY